MPKDLRNKQIYNLKKRGVPILHIAREYGISVERVRLICNKLRKKEIQPPPVSFATALSPSIGKFLSDYWGNNEILDNPDIIVDLGPAGLSNVKRIGIISVRKIAENLQRFGYIDDPDFWLAEKKP